MVEKKFYLNSQSDLQRIGCRAQIVSFLIEKGIKSGNVLNDSKDKKNVIVAVRVSFEPPNKDKELEEIENIRKTLVEHLNQLSIIDSECYTRFPTDISATPLKELDNPHPVSIVEMSTLSSGLMLEQTTKGVGAMLGLKSEFISLAKKLESLAELPQILKKMQK